MPRKAVLSAVQQAALTALHTAEHDLRLHYALSENDLAIIRSKRGLHNRLGFAIQLCYLRASFSKAHLKSAGARSDSGSPEEIRHRSSQWHGACARRHRNRCDAR